MKNIKTLIPLIVSIAALTFVLWNTRKNREQFNELLLIRGALEYKMAISIVANQNNGGVSVAACDSIWEQSTGVKLSQ